MKLPNVTYTGVQPLALDNPFAPLSVANAKSNALLDQARANSAIAKSVSNLFSSGVNALADIKQQQDETTARYQVEQSNLAMLEAEREVMTKYSAREEIPVDEIPSHLVTDSMRHRGVVPSAEILPKVYEDIMKQRIKDAAGIIDNKVIRRDWSIRAQQSFIKNLTNIQIKSSKKLQRQADDLRIKQIDSFIDGGNPDLSIPLVRGIDDPARKVEYTDKVNREIEKDKYSKVRLSNDIGLMQQAVEHLRSDQYNGKLDPQQREAEIARFNTVITRINAADRGEIQARKSLILRNARVLKENAFNDQDIPVDTFVETIDALSSLGDGSHAKETAELILALNYSEHRKRLAVIPVEEREEYIKKVVSSGEYSSVDTIDIGRRLHAYATKLQKQESIDPVQAIEDSKIVDLNPISLTKTKEEIAADIELRRRQVTLGAASKHIVTDSLLTKVEARTLTRELNSLPMAQQIESLGGVVDALGSDSIAFFEDLKTGNKALPFSIAGINVANGRVSDAQAVLRGYNFSRTAPDRVKAIKKQLEPIIEQKLGSMFDYSGKEYSARKEALMDAYIGHLLNDGVKLSDVDVKDIPGIIDKYIFGEKDYLESATQSALGNVITFNGSKFPAPDMKMTSEDFQSWVGHLHPDYISQLGSPAGITSEDVLGKIKSGYYTLVPVRQKEFALRRRDGSFLLDERTNTAFKLRYDPSAKQTEFTSVFGGLFKIRRDTD